MIRDQWDTDLAVTFGPLEEELDGQPTIDRYGITVSEELAGEPLAVALAQEEPDTADESADDPWAFIDRQWDVDDRRVSLADDYGPEASAMHLVPL